MTFCTYRGLNFQQLLSLQQKRCKFWTPPIQKNLQTTILDFYEIWRKSVKQVENTVEQERQIVARYARLTPSCKAGACTGQNSSMKNNKGQ